MEESCQGGVDVIASWTLYRREKCLGYENNNWRRKVTKCDHAWVEKWGGGGLKSIKWRVDYIIKLDIFCKSI
jgi:hypothetical protein